MGNSKLTLNKILDFINTDTKICLYVNEYTEISSGVPVYDFPARHDLNRYYDHEVAEIKATGEKKMAIYLIGEVL